MDLQTYLQRTPCATRIWVNDDRFYNLEVPYGTVDDVGCIFYETKVYRKISPKYIDRVKKIVDLGLNELIPSKFVEKDVIEHPYIPFISYISEWSPETLRSATITYVKLKKALLQHGLTLKDGHSLNTQFMGSRPYFIDVGSIMTNKGGSHWFKEFTTDGDWTFLKCLVDYAGLSFEEEFKLWKPDPDFMLNRINNYHFKSSDNGWAQYGQASVPHRPQLLATMPGTTLIDIGCNAGVYSIEAAKAGKKVVAIDLEPDVCDRLYKTASDQKLDILVLNYDLRNQYGKGKFNDRYSESSYVFRPANQRLKCDSGIAFALTHHLARAGWSFDDIIKMLTSYVRWQLIVEFVPKEDIHIRNWALPADYSLATFINVAKKYWHTIDIIDSVPLPRVLLVLNDKYSNIK